MLVISVDIDWIFSYNTIDYEYIREVNGMNKNEPREGMEIDLRRAMFALWSHAWMIAICAILAASLAVGYALFFIAPTYTANAQFYVNNTNNTFEEESFSSSQIDAAQNLAYTYMVILRSRSVLMDVAKQTGYGYTYAQLQNMISTSAVNGTEVFEVEVTATDPKVAANIANAIADVLPDKIAAVVDGSSVRIVDYAVENPNPVGPVYRTFLLLGALAGLALGVIFVVVMDIVDTTITNEEYLSHTYENVPLLAVIPGVEMSKNISSKGYYKGYYSSSHKDATKKNGGAK